jgi:hypothetical protein
MPDDALDDFFLDRFSGVLRRLSDRGLVHKIAAVWSRAARLGAWERDELDRVPFTIMTDPRGVGLLDHSIVAALGALELYQAMCDNYRIMPFTANSDYLLAGALLHDAGKLWEYGHGPGMHHSIATPVLTALGGLPDALVDIIVDVQGDGPPRRLEGVLIRQADMATYHSMSLLAQGLLITQQGDRK